MNRSIQQFRFILLIALTMLMTNISSSNADSIATLPQGAKKVIFIGDSITYAGGYIIDIEAYLLTRHADYPWQIINVGVSSETVSGLSELNHANGAFPRPDLNERLDRILDKTKPDLVFACYGMNDGIYLPLDEERFGKFRDGMQRMHDKIVASGAKIIHITPPVYDGVKTRNANYNQLLGKYSSWMMEQKSKGWDVIDIHTPMTAYLEAKQKSDRSFSTTKDGIHPNDEGNWLIAKLILQHLGAKDIESAEKFEEILPAHDDKLMSLIQAHHELLRNAYITDIGTPRPGLKKGLPVPVAQTQAEKILVEIKQLFRPAPATQQ